MSGFSLATQNPWWLDPKKIEADDQILRAGRGPVRWDPRILYTLNLGQDSVYTLRGPRQVGKTTAVKILIRKLLEDDVEPRHVFYWTCDLVSTHSELASLIDAYVEQTRRITKERLYIFLDEVSSVRDWQRAVKYLHDTGKLKDCTLLLTGSHSLDLRRAAERLPGRRGTSTGTLDKIMLPMKFSEYVEARDPDLRQLIVNRRLFHIERRRMILDALGRGEIPQEIEELDLHSTTLSRLLDDYLVTGGVIAAVNEYASKGRIDAGLYETYRSAIVGDVARWGMREVYLSALLRRIDETTTSRVSWTALKRDTDIGHTNTVADYVDALESSYILQVLYNANQSTLEPQPEKEKKLYFKDPFIYHSLSAWVRQEPPYERSLRTLAGDGKSRLVESVVCDHLARLAYNLNPSDAFEPRRSLLYQADRSREVDFAVKDGGTFRAFEVKYQNTVNRSDYNGLPQGHGTLITKNTLGTHRDTAAVPAHIFLTLI